MKLTHLLCFLLMSSLLKQKNLSRLFLKGKLIYSDDFNDVHEQQNYAGDQARNRTIKDGIDDCPSVHRQKNGYGKLSVTTTYLDVVAHLNKLPKSLSVTFATKLSPKRSSLDALLSNRPPYDVIKLSQRWRPN